MELRLDLLSLHGKVHNLSTQHPVDSRPLGQNQGSLRRPVRLNPRPESSLKGGDKGVGQQSVPRQQGGGLRKLPVARGFAPTVVVIVHTGQVVVYQGIGVDHLHRRPKGHGLFLWNPVGAGELQCQNRPNPLAPSQQAVAHGLKALPLGAFPQGKQPVQRLLYFILIVLHLLRE